MQGRASNARCLTPCSQLASNHTSTQVLHRVLNICNVLHNLLHTPQCNLSIRPSRLLRKIQVIKKTCNLRLKTPRGSSTRLPNQRSPGASLLTFYSGLLPSPNHYSIICPTRSSKHTRKVLLNFVAVGLHPGTRKAGSCKVAGVAIFNCHVALKPAHCKTKPQTHQKTKNSQKTTDNNKTRRVPRGR